jgi:hypothetical protein
MATLGTFTAGQVLTAAELNAIGTYTAYTPTFTNLTVGNGTRDFKYTQINKFVHVNGKFTFGSTSSVSGGVLMSLPANISMADNQWLGTARLDDSGVGTLWGMVIGSGATQVAIQAVNTSGTYMNNTSFTATVPFTWSTNDSITVSFIYQSV